MIYFNIAWYCCICGGYDRARPGRGRPGEKRKKGCLEIQKRQTTAGSGA